MKRTFLLIILLAIAAQFAQPQERRFTTPAGQVIEEAAQL